MPERSMLPYVQLTAFKGLHTKVIPSALSGEQLQVSQNTDFFKKYQGVSKIKGATRILTTPYTESSTVKPISSIMFYNYPDLDGRLLREVLIAAGTTLQLVNSDGSLTSLATGRTSGLPHSWDAAKEFILIQNQNPRLIGQGDQPVKYDGHEISNWGINAPGDTTDQELEEFDDATDWTSSNATLTNELIVTRDGSSLKLVQGGGSAEARITKDYGVGNTFTLNTDSDDRVTIQVYFDPETYDNLRTSSHCLAITFSSNADVPIVANYYRFTFFIGQLSPGWNELSMDFTAAPTGSTGSSNGVLLTNAVRTLEISVFGASAASGIIAYFDALQELEVGEPQGSFSGVGSVFDNDATSAIWRYRVTFLTKYGLESNAGPALVMDNRSGPQDYAQVDLTDIPISSDPATTARIIYRTTANSSIFLRLTTINDNTTTTYTDTIPDASLGVQTPPTASGDQDNSPPPKGGIVKEFIRTVFIAGDPANPTLLYYSNDDEPEQFPLENTLNLGEVITGMYETSIALFITTLNGVWRLMGVNPDWTLDKLFEGFGAAGPRMVGTSRFIGWMIDKDGMRLFDGNNMEKPSEVIRDQYDDMDRANMPTSFSAHSSGNNAILHFIKDSNGNVQSALMYQYPADVVMTGYWTTLSFPASIEPLDAFEILDEDGKPRLYVGGDDGMLYEWLSDDSENWVNAGGTASAIDTIVETPYIRPGENGANVFGMTGRVPPRFIEVQAQGDECTWEATVYSANGVSQPTERDSQTVDCEFTANVALQRIPVNIHSGEFLKIRLRNNELGVTSTIETIRVHYPVKSGQFPVT